jgi:hypothetical protein
MRRRRRHRSWSWLAAVALAASMLSAPASALARPKVEWASIEVPHGDEAARRVKVLRTALEQAARKANFGKAKSVTLSAKVVEFTVERRGEILRVTCTVLGRVQGAASAKSKISFGGSPGSQVELENQVMTTVASGLVARLAQIARTQAQKDQDTDAP